jgi:hypothetical protein
VFLPSFSSFASHCNYLELAPLLELAPCPPGVLLHALLELVLAMIFYLLLYWVSSPASTGAVTISGCDVFV